MNIAEAPFVTVLLPVYNGEKYLQEAIDSILYQTYSKFELLIINDGSIDKTAEIISSCSDNRINYVENNVNLGLIATLNKGIEIAKGKYIVRMDADASALLLCQHRTQLLRQLDHLFIRASSLGMMALHSRLLDGRKKLAVHRIALAGVAQPVNIDRHLLQLLRADLHLLEYVAENSVRDEDVHSKF